MKIYVKLECGPNGHIILKRKPKDKVEWVDIVHTKLDFSGDELSTRHSNMEAIEKIQDMVTELIKGGNEVVWLTSGQIQE